METFYSVLRALEPKDKELFIDEEDCEWTVRVDGTGMLISVADPEGTGGAVKFTEHHLKHCKAPTGFRRKTVGIFDELDWLTKTMRKATKRMAELQDVLVQAESQSKK